MICYVLNNNIKTLCTKIYTLNLNAESSVNIFMLGPYISLDLHFAFLFTDSVMISVVASFPTLCVSYFIFQILFACAYCVSAR
jgi:hypothetical protein